METGQVQDPLARTITLTGAALAVVHGEERGPWLFARCWMSVERFQHDGHHFGDLESALADLDALPAAFPGRAKLAAVLVVAIVKSGNLDAFTENGRAIALADLADADPRPLADWPVTSAAIRSSDILRAVRSRRPGFRPHAALKDLDRYEQIVGNTEPQASMVRAARLGLATSATAGTDSVMDPKALKAMEELGPQYIARGGDRDGFLVYQAMFEAQSAAMQGDWARMRAAFDTMRRLAGQLPPGHSAAMAVAETMALVGPFLAQGEPGSGPPLSADALAPLIAHAERPGLSPAERASAWMAVGGAAMQGTSEKELTAAIGYLDKALDLAPPNDPFLPLYLTSAGTAHMLRMKEIGRRLDDLNLAIGLFERSVEAAGNSTNSSWTMANTPLSMAYRLDGRLDLSRRTGLRGLQGHTWNALLQAGAADTHATVRHAAEEALDLARICIEDGDVGTAALALEAGRGLILFAAQERRGIAARLDAVGERHLAQQWIQAVAGGSENVPADLRLNVIGKLVGVPLAPDGTMTTHPADGTTRLLEPPSLHEVRAALTALSMDALVYLVPGDSRSGFAVIIPAAQEPIWLSLPNLNTDGLAPFEAYITAASRTQADPASERLRDLNPAGDKELDEVCDWAWRTAVGPLFDRGLQLPADRPARIVLIPVRDLARVPWHAARLRTADGKAEYALQKAVFSYAASARMMCESAWRGDVPLSDHGLVVADPATAGAAGDLSSARLEAIAVRETFYPGARYLGRLPDGSRSPEGGGDAAELRAWFDDPSGGPMVHLACHGVVRAGLGPDETSYLVLEAGSHLAAEEIADSLSAGSRDLSLAVLAACSSGATGRGYDEAFSLSTVFLAAGVRSVISAQWPVPDSATSVLMYLFHHCLRREGLAPVDALREAQLWLLEGREPPAQMPEELRRRILEQDLAGLTAWGAFVHGGR